MICPGFSVHAAPLALIGRAAGIPCVVFEEVILVERRSGLPDVCLSIHLFFALPISVFVYLVYG